MVREVEARLKISAVDRTGRVLKNVGDKLSNVNSRAEQYNRTLGTMGRTGNLAMGVIMRAGTAAFAAFGAGAIYAAKQAATFEEALFAIQKKSGATAKQMDVINGEIKDLATELPVSIEEIASAFERGAAAGIPLDELKEFAKITASVADAWDTTAESVANTFAGFTAGLGISRKDLVGYASLINDLADAGIADETGIADFVDRVGASLKNFGMTPEEIAAYGAAMLNLKMPAEVGARAMDTITGKLIAPENLSKKSYSALRDIVGDMEQFAKLSGNQKFVFFMSKLEKMTSQRRASLLGALLGEGFDDEIMRLVSGSDEMRRNLKLAQEHVAKPSTSIIEAQTRKLELFNSQMQIMRNHFEDIGIDVGERILPSLTDIAKHINETLSEGRAYSKGVSGMSREEQNQQYKWFIKAFEDIYPNDWTATGRAMSKYDEAVAMVGRGEIADVYDYIERIRANERYISGQNKASVGRQNMSIVRPQDAEFPGGSRDLDPYNMPADVPVPFDRNAPTAGGMQNLRDQYRLYGNAQRSVRYPTRAVRSALLKMADPAQLGMDGLGGVLIESGQQASSSMKEGGEQAGEKLVEGGEKAASALSAAADKLLSALSAINRLGNFVQPSGGRTVNADTGRSMPPSTFGPR